MDIRQLHYFLTLCEEMNYTRAAQRLFLSRQALRQSISALEAEMCGPLFVSAHHKLSLTERGLSLQRHAAPVVEQFQQMQAALHAEIQSAQPVRIGISVSLVPDYLPGLETQLDKLEDVRDIKELKPDRSVYRELMMVKVRASAQDRQAISAISNIFRATIVDVGRDSLTVMLTGDQSKLDALINLLEDYEILELARTGLTGLSRGSDDIRYLP